MGLCLPILVYVCPGTAGTGLPASAGSGHGPRSGVAIPGSQLHSHPAGLEREECIPSERKAKEKKGNMFSDDFKRREAKAALSFCPGIAGDLLGGLHPTVDNFGAESSAFLLLLRQCQEQASPGCQRHIFVG